MTIFYADDDEDDLMLFEEAVANFALTNKMKIDLSLVVNGVGLIEQLVKNGIANAMVLLDLNMPFKSGFDLMNEIRQHNVISDATIVILSTSNDQETINKSLRQGANYYFCKPNDFFGLETLIDKLFHIDWKKNDMDGQHIVTG